MRLFQRRRPRKPKIYIVPSKNGFLFLGVNIVVLISAGTYSNNLVFMLAFLMFAIFITSMVHTHNNLRGVRVEIVDIRDTASSQPVQVLARITNTSRVVRQRIEVNISAFKKTSGASLCKEYVHPSQSVAGQFEMPNPGRGVHVLDRLTFSTVYPLGLFYAWAYEYPEHPFYVYPKPEGIQRMQRAIPYRNQSSQFYENKGDLRGDEFNEHKSYLPGESFRHVDWKVYARKRLLLKKTFEGDEPVIYSFRYQDTHAKDHEVRLQQLAKWIETAHKSGHHYELVLPANRMLADGGIYHYQKCLRELARIERAA